MARRFDDAKQWRARAEEARDLAEQLTNPETKRIMLGIAVSYVTLAQIAEGDGAGDDATLSPAPRNRKTGPVLGDAPERKSGD